MDDLEKWKVEMESYKCELEKWKTKTLTSLTVYQQVNIHGQAAMKAALLINSGASVAMLAFIGTAMNNETNSLLLSRLCCSMLMFIIGVLSAAIAFGVTYLAGFVAYSNNDTDQYNKKTSILWNILNFIAISLVVIGYILFITGSLVAYFAFTNSLS